MTDRVHQFLSQLSIAHPIIQAPMAGGITTPELVSAVSAAGGLGSFGAAYMRPDELRSAIHHVQKNTSCPYQVNLFVPDKTINYKPQHHTQALERLKNIYEAYGVNLDTESAKPRDDFENQIKVVLEEKTPVVSFTFGIPDPSILIQLRQAGTFIIGTATCVAEAMELVDAKVDAIVAQGFEAGGHRGTFHSTLRNSKEIPNIGLFSLVPQLVDKIKIPIIASGGIMDGKGILAALILGAAAVQLGTAFMGCPEAQLPESWRQALFHSSDTDTSLTHVFSGRHARGIGNHFMKEMNDVYTHIPPFPFQNALTGPLRAEAKRRDDAQYQSLWAGQTARLTRRLPVAQLMQAFVKEIESAAHQMNAF